VGAIVVVVCDVLMKQAKQVAVVEDDDMVEELATDAADPPFGDAVLPRAPRGRSPLLVPRTSRRLVRRRCCRGRTRGDAGRCRTGTPHAAVAATHAASGWLVTWNERSAVGRVRASSSLPRSLRTSAGSCCGRICVRCHSVLLDMHSSLAHGSLDHDGGPGAIAYRNYSINDRNLSGFQARNMTQ